jgi:hypothetical protein
MGHGSRYKVAVVVLLLLAASSQLPACHGANYEREFILIDGDASYRLYLSVTDALYAYYQEKEHRQTVSNLPTFVTPYALAPVAADIRSLFPDNEAFVNAVLMLVHQIPYRVINASRYPVETIVEDEGDCDLLAYIAASLLVAEGLNVVLLYYEAANHINVGVDLPAPPKDARTTVTFFEMQGTRYYVAECTCDVWRDGWRVGEYPPDLDGVSANVIALDGVEQVSPGQVSSSFSALTPASLSLTVTLPIAITGREVLLTGQASFLNASVPVTLYAASSTDWVAVDTVELDVSGRYAFAWTPTIGGQYLLKASCTEGEVYVGADSETITVYVVPQNLVVVGVGVAAFTIILTALVRATHPRESTSAMGVEPYDASVPA